MEKKNIFKVVAVATATMVLLTGCSSAKLKSGESKAVELGSKYITSNTYYDAIKSTNISRLVDMIDHKLLDKKYPTDDTETKEVESEITKMKSNYSNNESGFLSAIQSYFGVSTEAELKTLLRLEYKRNLAVKDYLTDNLTKAEIQNYYDTEVIGDIKCSHILIKVSSSDSATDAEKTAAEKKALAKAESIIKKLDNGAKFSDMAKKYSEDSGTASNGGDLGYVKKDEMDSDFMAALEKLSDGKYSETPVKTQYGYHIIYRVKQKAKASLKSLTSTIKTTLVSNKLSADAALHYKTLVKIREKAGIKFNDDALKSAYENLMDKEIENATSSSTSSNS
jgi:foldase protein PrsA